MNTAIWVGIGGCIGSVLRYWASGLIVGLSQSVGFPFATLAVNVVGCFAIGFLSELAESRGSFGPEARAFVFVGILGGFTTFSTFGNETVYLLREGQRVPAMAYVGASVGLGLGAVVLGRAVAQVIWRAA
jgi:CrcB protein